VYLCVTPGCCVDLAQGRIGNCPAVVQLAGDGKKTQEGKMSAVRALAQHAIATRTSGTSPADPSLPEVLSDNDKPDAT
jgi:hypothetical protein